MKNWLRVNVEEFKKLYLQKVDSIKSFGFDDNEAKQIVQDSIKEGIYMEA